VKVAIISKTPLASAPYELWKALRKYTKIEASLILQKQSYPDGRTFPGQYRIDADGAKAMLEADVWHVNNYWFPEIEALHTRKQPILAQFHSLPRLGNWNDLWKRARARYTISQPLHLKEYEIPGLPNVFDPDEHQPAPRPNEGPVRIAFAPTSKAPVGWPCSKAYAEVKAALDALEKEREFERIWIEGRAYEENLAMKRRADILIDDITTGNFHRTSLEGAAFGCAVLNKLRAVPWVYADTGTIIETLKRLIDEPGDLATYQEMARAWILSEWHPIELVKKYEKAYEALA
jgi:hypothetical protein